MTDRPRNRWRIGVIFGIGCLALVSLPIALVDSAHVVQKITRFPAPQHLAALTLLVDEAAPQDRDTLLRALGAAQLSVTVVSDAPPLADVARSWPEGAAPVAEYRRFLGDRPFEAHAIPRKVFNSGVAHRLTAVEFRIGLTGGDTLIVASDRSPLFAGRGVPLGFPVMYLCVLIALVSLLVLHREFRSILRLARVVEAIDPYDPDAQIPPIRAGTAEVRTLIEVFTRQQARVATLLRARSALIGGIQHDVRTFATRLRLRMDKLADPIEREKAETDVSDLVALMDGALQATRAEGGKLCLELIDFPAFLEAEIRDRQANGAEASLIVHAEARDTEILADRLALRRILSNLLENALNFGSAVQVSLHMDPGNAVLTIEDDGPGIPADHRAALLEPFARLEPSRSRQTGGAGLGLAIVKTLVESHHGALSIGDADIGGARIEVRLPTLDQMRQG